MHIEKKIMKLPRNILLFFLEWENDKFYNFMFILDLIVWEFIIWLIIYFLIIKGYSEISELLFHDKFLPQESFSQRSLSKRITPSPFFSCNTYKKGIRFLEGDIICLRDAVKKKNCIFSDICSNRGGGVWKNLIQKINLIVTKY